MNTLARPTHVLLLACAAALLPASARAEDFLDVDAAFRLQPQAAEGRAVLAFDIAPGYYLYRERFAVEPQGAAPKPADVRYPKGEVKHDPNFDQDMEVYHQAVRVEAGFDAQAPAGDALLKVTYQGCADAGLCYPPKSRLLRVSLGAGGKVVAVADAGGDAAATPSGAPATAGATDAGTPAAASAPAAATGWAAWPLWQKALAAVAALVVVVLGVRALSGGAKPSA